MSLIKQLWIAIATITVIALGGSLAVSMYTAKHYLEQQLNVKNTDNATVLALALSQSSKDPVLVELQLASQFDAGHYRAIRLTSPEGRTVIDLQAPANVDTAPAWFVRFAAIEERPGVAHVQDGWRQFGTLTVESHTGYVYAALWESTLDLLSWFGVTALGAGILGSLLLGRLTSPLRTLVNHAQAIGERRFITTPEPSTAELKVVVRAMNTLSGRVRQMLADEAQRLETLRRQVQEDSVTGLLERRQFLNVLVSRLSDSEAPAAGALLILRVGQLAELNLDRGRVATDQLLRELAQALRGEADEDTVGGRLNGSDFALIAPDGVEPREWVNAVASRVRAVADRQAAAGPLTLPLAAVAYHRGDSPPTVLARLDNALAEAEHAGEPALRFAAGDGSASFAPRNQETWRTALLAALEQDGLQLGAYPVRDIHGGLLHHEAPVRLNLEGEWHNAGDFLPWATRFNLMGRLDLAVVKAALDRIRHEGEQVAVHISAQAFQDGQFVTELIALLRVIPGYAAKLWMEISEAGAARHPTAFRAFCLAVKSLDCKVGLEHAGPHFSALGDLQDLGLDFLKVDTSLLRELDDNEGNRSFVRSLAMLAHAIGLIVIAEGITRPGEETLLAALGFDGLSGAVE
jgi:EAL domain-containing protein (putative c-di-GMP-specific phosphodiesterase class I)/GGDEF domain-containing protein